MSKKKCRRLGTVSPRYTKFIYDVYLQCVLSSIAFALPALTRLVARSAAISCNTKKGVNKRLSVVSSPRMLVLAPTRELAMQSDEVLQEFGAVVGLKSLVVYGGVPKYQQISALKQQGGVDCLVATPGRLKDLIQEQSCSLDQVEFLVLDEAGAYGSKAAFCEMVAACCVTHRVLLGTVLCCV